LAGGVRMGREEGVSHQSEHGSDVDDRTLAAGAHGGDGKAAAEVDALQVRFDHEVPGRFGAALDRAVAEAPPTRTSGVDEHVEATERRERALDQAARLFLAGDVRRAEANLVIAAEGAERLGAAFR